MIRRPGMRNTAEERSKIIVLARKYFIETGITKNITEALRLYLEAHEPDSDSVPLRITQSGSGRPKTILDDYVRPKCPEDGADLYLQEKCSGMGKGDRITIWICRKCGYKDYSEKTQGDWLAELPKKE